MGCQWILWLSNHFRECLKHTHLQLNNFQKQKEKGNGKENGKEKEKRIPVGELDLATTEIKSKIKVE